MHDAELRGLLSRRTGFFAKFKPFTFIKRDQYLVEYKAGSNPVTATPLAMYDLKHSFVEEAFAITGQRNSFILHMANGKSIFLLANSTDEKNKWMTALAEASDESKAHAQPQPKAATSNASLPLSPTSSGDTRSDQHSVHSGHHSNPDDEDPSRLPILNYLESFTDAVVVGDSNGFIVATNSAADKMFGFVPGTSKGQSLNVLMPEPYKSQHDAFLFRHQKFGSEKLIGKTRTIVGERQNKEVFPIQISLGKLPTGNFYIATIRELPKEEESKSPKPVVRQNVAKAADAVAASSPTDAN